MPHPTPPAPVPHRPAADSPAHRHPALRAAQPSFTSQEFRAALGQFATGVTIVTTRDAQGHTVGLTANSFNSVSLDPPLVLWSLAKRSSSLAAFKGGTHFCINVLTHEQRLLAERFASKAIDRFDGVAWRSGAGGAPIIDGAAAVFECFHHSHHDAGDHIIFIGQVERCDRRLGSAPLVFHGGRFIGESIG